MSNALDMLINGQEICHSERIFTKSQQNVQGLNNPKSDVSDNKEFVNMIHKSTSSDNIVTYLGVDLYSCYNHVSISFKDIDGSNLLIWGKDFEAAVSIISLINYQISKNLNDVGGSIFIADFFPSHSKYAQYLKKNAQACGVRYIHGLEIVETVSHIEEMLNSRMHDDSNGIGGTDEPVFLTLSYIQSSLELRDIGFKESELSKKIQYLLMYGPDYGIHVILYSSYTKGTMLENVYHVCGNKIKLTGGSGIGRQCFREGLDGYNEYIPTRGSALLYSHYGPSAYIQQPFIVYNECSEKNTNTTLDSIFSIYKNKPENKC